MRASWQLIAFIVSALIVGFLAVTLVLRLRRGKRCFGCGGTNASNFVVGTAQDKSLYKLRLSARVKNANEETLVFRTLRTGSADLVLIENFLTPSECEHLVKLAKDRFARSPVQGAKNEREISTDRTSTSASLRRAEDSIVKEIERRAAQLVAHPLEHLEPLQVVKYEPGQYYKPHYDYFPVDAEGSAMALKRGGQRTVTIFAYLNTPEDPNNCVTRFPNLDNLGVPPRQGAAAVWHNLLPSGEENSLLFHGGEPPKKGIKYGLNVWFREHPFS